MKNKIELKKTIMYSLMVIAISSVVLGVISVYQYRVYTNHFNQKIETIMAVLQEKYPMVDKNEIMEILNREEGNCEFLFKNYGIDLNQESLVLENDQSSQEFLLVNVGVIIVTSFLLLFLFLKYNKSKEKKLNQITKYIEEINHRNYKLDMEDNTEDELSILKNEIYKTTIMLKEIAENSLNDKMKLKDSLSDISHQLKTPLTSIMIMLDNILEDREMNPDTRNEFIRDIKREVNNIHFLINALLKLSKFDANVINFYKKEELIQTLIQEAIENVAILCDLKNIEISVTGNEQSKIYCDLKWQVEAITNIVKNCVEHSSENSKIEITYEQNKVYSKIEIRDYGMGIEEEDLPHIFERFYKGKNSSSESIGIGLALAKSIIENNNGYIDVESKWKEGTIFTIKYLN